MIGGGTLVTAGGCGQIQLSTKQIAATTTTVVAVNPPKKIIQGDMPLRLSLGLEDCGGD